MASDKAAALKKSKSGKFVKRFILFEWNNNKLAVFIYANMCAPGISVSSTFIFISTSNTANDDSLK
jgi:hypothetical protein